MTFKPGVSGNPRGARKPAVFFESLMISLKRIPIDTKEAKTKLQAIANKLVTLAENGDMQAIKYIMDRVDGSPTATVDMNINDNRDIAEHTDSELTEIIREISSGGTAETQDSPPQPDSVH